MNIENQDVNNPGGSSAPVDVTPAASSSAPSDNSSTPASDATPAPSTGESGTPPAEAKTPLDVVRNVLTVTPKPDAEKKPDAQASTPDATTPKAAETPGKLPELTPEEEAKLPFHKHPRWQEMVAQRNDARTRAAELEEPARQFGMVQEFMTKNQLTPPEMADGFTVMALMRNEPAKAIPILEEYLGQLKLLTGQVLPADLQAQVDSGAITDAAAKELADSRLKLAKTTVESTRNAEIASANAAQNARTQSANAVNAWEVQTRSNDPDYDRKKPFIKDAIVAQTAGLGRIPTPAEAIAIAKRAYDSVTERFKGLGPRPAGPTPPQPRSGDSANPGTGNKAAPKTPLEAAKRGLGMA